MRGQIQLFEGIKPVAASHVLAVVSSEVVATRVSQAIVIIREKSNTCCRPGAFLLNFLFLDVLTNRREKRTISLRV